MWLLIVLAACFACADAHAEPVKFLDRSAAEWQVLLTNGQEERRDAMRALASGDSGAVPILVELLGSSSGGVRGVAAIGLSRMRVLAPEVVPALSRALADPDLNVRYGAAKALAKFGPAAKSAVPALAAAYGTCVEGRPELKGPPRFLTDCRAVSIEALAAIDPVGAQATLKQALKDPSPAVREAASKALATAKLP